MYSIDVKKYYKETINDINGPDLHREPARTDTIGHHQRQHRQHAHR
jgi:hypothetical protein